MPVTLVNDDAESTSVTGRILLTFLEALATEEGCQEVAERLRTTMLAHGDVTERALRTALFGDGAP